MAKCVLFISTRYYPSGGMDDFIGSYDSLEAAQDVVNKFVDMCKRTIPLSWDDITAEIALCSDDGLQMVSRYTDKQWSSDTDTPTIESHEYGGYLQDSFADFLHPERIEERERAYAEREAKEKRDALAEQLRQQGWDARKRGDDDEVTAIGNRLREIGEDW
jgi:hypothetical protein